MATRIDVKLISAEIREEIKAETAQFAKENGFPIKRYLPDWKKYGKAAGPIRNKQMVDICHKVICFWDGKSKGTESLIRYAKKSEKKIDIKLIHQRA